VAGNNIQVLIQVWPLQAAARSLPEVQGLFKNLDKPQKGAPAIAIGQRPLLADTVEKVEN
jgi:hypothetical protein